MSGILNLRKNLIESGIITNLNHKFRLAWPKKNHLTILPVFIPFLGCKSRCVFCAQDAQTGVKIASSNELITGLSAARKIMLTRAKAGLEPCELAFYGGTFTALPECEWEMCLNFASQCLEKGYISGFRCSTRPDSLTSARLAEMKKAGCRLVELGIQSFAEHALIKADRGYDTHTCLLACKKVITNNLRLGVQLMPGMPGMNGKDFFNDVLCAIRENASIIRFYPCLVISGTKLALLWRNNNYKPWSLNYTLHCLAKAWLLASINKINVIRMGLAPQPELSSRILAGPVHPSLGNRVMSRALFIAIKLLIASSGDASKNIQISLPEHLQGLFWGWQKELVDRWSRMGIISQNIKWWGNDYIELELID